MRTLKFNPTTVAVLTALAVLLAACTSAAAQVTDESKSNGPPAKGDDGVSSSASTYHPDEMHTILGFKVEITGAGSGSDVDSMWETATGGSLNIEVCDASTGCDPTHVTTPGHKYVDVLTLRGPLTGGRRGAGVNENSYEVLENGAGKFKLEIDGAPTASANVESITMEDLVIDVREMTTGADWDYRVFGPGDAHFGSITIRSRVGKDSRELYQWWLDTSRGKNIWKSISVTILDRDGGEARRIDYVECFPTTYKAFVLDGSTDVALEGVTVTCGGIHLQATGARKALVEWIQATVDGKEWKRDLAIEEKVRRNEAATTFTYTEGFPTRYVFPSLSASGTGNLYEEVAMKPIRLEIS